MAVSYEREIRHEKGHPQVALGDLRCYNANRNGTLPSTFEVFGAVPFLFDCYVPAVLQQQAHMRDLWVLRGELVGCVY